MKLIDSIGPMLRIDRPNALGWDEWEEWHEKTKAEKPLAYLIHETIPSICRRTWQTVSRPFIEAKYWIRVRLFDRYHIIHTGLKPGYEDTDNRMMHGMFNLLVDFVEIELAWKNVIFDKESAKKYQHPWWSLGRTRFKAFRDPAAGLDYVKWEMTLDSPKLPAHEQSPHQAEKAREVWQIYHWWKVVRPNRPDPDDASGMDAYRRENPTQGLFSRRTDPKELELITRGHEIEQAYDDEDQEMLIRLIKIRKSLWS